MLSNGYVIWLLHPRALKIHLPCVCWECMSLYICTRMLWRMCAFMLYVSSLLRVFLSTHKFSFGIESFRFFFLFTLNFSQKYHGEMSIFDDVAVALSLIFFFFVYVSFSFCRSFFVAIFEKQMESGRVLLYSFAKNTSFENLSSLLFRFLRSSHCTPTFILSLLLNIFFALIAEKSSLTLLPFACSFLFFPYFCFRLLYHSFLLSFFYFRFAGT